MSSIPDFDAGMGMRHLPQRGHSGLTHLGDVVNSQVPAGLEWAFPALPKDDNADFESDLGEPADGPYIKYEMAYVDRNSGGLLKCQTAYHPLILHDGQADEDEDHSAVFTVRGDVTAISLNPNTYLPPYDRRERRSGRHKRRSSVNYFDDIYEDGAVPYMLPPKAEPVFSIQIHSQSIIRALQAVVKHYKELKPRDGHMSVKAPYAMLMHNLKAIQDYRERFNPEKLSDSACSISRNTYAHLGLLLQYLSEVMPVSEIEALSSGNSPRVEFVNLWQCFKPGTPVLRPTSASASSSTRIYDVYEDACGNYNPGDNSDADIRINETDFDTRRSGRCFGYDGAVVVSCRLERNTDCSQMGQPVKYSTGRRITKSYWSIESVSLDYDGKNVVSVTHWDDIELYDGACEISQLPVFPMSHATSDFEGLSAMEHLKNAGRSFCDLLRPQCKLHKGMLLKFPHHEMEGQVQVDFAACFDRHPQLRPRRDPPPEDLNTEVFCDCTACANVPDCHEADILMDIRAAVAGESSAIEKCHFLFPSFVYVYVYKTRDWKPVYTAQLFEPGFKQNMIDTLVMQEKRREMLQALARNFAQRDSDRAATVWNADFVEGKGNNQIFLLHGPPGVGKTYTAECIAHYTSRPLMTLTSGDIGVKASEAESNLIKAFTLAKKWGAVLLIDEADIYLERRSLKDLTRNSLVASFLRALDFYEGVLFLTTNRVGSFDDAFISRIQVKLHYPPLSNTDRLRIWNNFIDKLQRERGEVISVAPSVHKYISSIEVSDLKLNGREIRNIFQTAVTLAIEGGKGEDGMMIVNDSHLAQVMEAACDFKLYLEDHDTSNEGTRARRRKNRKGDKKYDGDGEWSVVDE